MCTLTWGALRELPEGASAAYGLHGSHHEDVEGRQCWLQSAYKISRAGDDVTKLIEWLNGGGLAHTRRVYKDALLPCEMSEPRLLVDHGRYKCWARRFNSAAMLTWTYHPEQACTFQHMWEMRALGEIDRGFTRG